jgi:hypothetical protein
LRSVVISTIAAEVAETFKGYVAARIADGDPMIAALELVRIYLRNARRIDDDPEAPPPSFEDFRSTIELLDRRSRSFVQQAAQDFLKLRLYAPP